MDKQIFTEVYKLGHIETYFQYIGKITKEKAEEYLKLIEKFEWPGNTELLNHIKVNYGIKIPNKTTVYLIYRNSDMTEGRGPMILNNKPSGFFNLQDANDYIDQQPGVMGLRSKWSEVKSGGDWEVRPVEIID